MRNANEARGTSTHTHTHVCAFALNLATIARRRAPLRVCRALCLLTQSVREFVFFFCRFSFFFFVDAYVYVLCVYLDTARVKVVFGGVVVGMGTDLAVFAVQ